MSALESLILFLAVGFCSSQSAPTILTSLGKIRGHYLVSYEGRRYEAYEGVPYALPPVGNRRFEPPQPIESWPGELAADKKGNSCLQHHRIRNINGTYVFGDEDCLNLNIYVPTRTTNESLPVIFWIHGGAFQYGAGSRFGAKYLIDYNVILVTVNYRLGVLGFLSTEDNVVSGNMGLKDQNMALRWVHENIANFGGDTKRVTLTGLSAGGASVHYHYLSPMSAGLFHSGISFSGTAFNCWTLTENSREKALEMAGIVNCPTNNSQEMIRCFKNRSGKDLMEVVGKFMPWHLNPFTPFGPVVERYADNPFINRPPIEIINSGQVQDLPWITGVASEEGLYPVAEFALKEEVLKDLNDNWESIAPYLLDYYYTIPKHQHATVARVIREHYLANKTINKENLSNLTHLVGDRLFFADAIKAANAQAKVNQNPVWFYYYNYRANQSVSDDLSNSKENFGVCHGDDINLVLENSHVSPTKTKTDFAMHKDLIKLWVTVARKGVPKFGPKWSRVDPNNINFNYLHIAGPGQYETKFDPNLAERQFWNSINFDENREIIKTYLGHDTWKSSSDTPMCYVALIITCAALHYANVPSL